MDAPQFLTFKEFKVILKKMSNEDLIGELNGFPITGTIGHNGKDYDVLFPDDDDEDEKGVEGMLSEEILSRMEKRK